jgi:integrase
MLVDELVGARRRVRVPVGRRLRVLPPGARVEARPRLVPDRFLEALAEAGIEGQIRAFHDVRHTALTNLAASGASPIAVMATAGHRSMQTTKQYVHLAGVVLRDEADALERRPLSGYKIRVQTRPKTHR